MKVQQNHAKSNLAHISWCPANFPSLKMLTRRTNRDPFYWHRFNLIPAWTINHISSKVWDVITYPCPDLKSAMKVNGPLAYLQISMPNLSTQLQKCTDAYGYTVEGINTSAGHNLSWRIKSSGAHFTEICTVEPHFNTWWRHQMAIFSALLALCEGNPPVAGGFPS